MLPSLLRRRPPSVGGVSKKEKHCEEGFDLLFLFFKRVFPENFFKWVDLGLKNSLFLFCFSFSLTGAVTLVPEGCEVFIEGL